jgi:hypothetical protein
MKKLSLEDLQLHSGGEQLPACVMTGIFLVLAATNWWNPGGYFALEGAIIGGMVCFG